MSTAPAQPIPLPADWRDFLSLTKPRVMSLVIFTGLCGLLAAPVPVDPILGFTAVLCIALGAGGSAALNQWWEADLDAMMKRTASRPLPAGRMERAAARDFGVALSVASVLIMGLACGWLAAAILAFSIFYYAVIYTVWLKPRTPQNIVIGGGAGAFPPMIGWIAATGEITLMPVLLFAIIFFWTPPHFWALSLLAHKEYAKVSVPMLPVTHGAKATRLQILIYTLVLIPVSLSPLATGLGGWIYAITAGVGGLVFLVCALAILRSRAGDDGAPAADMKLARNTFLFSILYLFALFGAVLVEHAAGLHFPVLGG